jgi:amidase
MEDIVKAEIQRAKMLKSTNDFFETYDLLLVPTAIVPPYPVEQRFIEECNGHKFNNYIEWLGIVYAITLTTCPALSLPCGFTKAGLPVGLQVIARPRGEAQVLAGAKILETILALDLKPIDPR